MLIAGFDEVGRGAWAGPLVVAGVVLDGDIETDSKDSKTYTPAGRLAAVQDIYQAATAISISCVPASEIDEIGLGAALNLAFNSAANTLSISPDSFIVDGNIDYLGYDNSTAVIKADDSCQSVAAASIVAKVHRDNFMMRAGELDQRYGFECHVGYGTARHKQQLNIHGPTSLHRHSFKPVQAAA